MKACAPPFKQGSSVILHTILLGVGGTIYNNHTLEPLNELGLDYQRVKKLASKLRVHSVNYVAKLVHTRRALSSTVINSHQETRFSVKPATLLIPVDLFFLLVTLACQIAAVCCRRLSNTLA